MKKLDNRGFTLTELIVVIAIIGILAGVTSASINQIFSNQTKNFINDCDAMLTRCRVETLSGAPTGTCVELRLEDGKYYVAYYEGNRVAGEAPIKVEEELLKNNSASCAYTKADGTEGSLPLRISYNRTTGAINEDCTEIAVGNSKITLVPATGYHKVGG